jgi:hypothetical protein
MEKLDSDTLARVLALAAGFKPALRGVCSRWRALLGAPRAQQARRPYTLAQLAFLGHDDLILWAREAKRGEFSERTVNRIFVWAAAGGRETVLRASKPWGPWDYRRAMLEAAKRGHLPVLALLKGWADAQYRETLRLASAEKWPCAPGPPYCAKEIADAAAKAGQHGAAQLARGWAPASGRRRSVGPGTRRV